MGGVTTDTIWVGILQLATLVLILGVLYRPLGDTSPASTRAGRTCGSSAASTG